MTLLTMMMPAPNNENDNEIINENADCKSDSNENYDIDETDWIVLGETRVITVSPCWGLRDTRTSSKQLPARRCSSENHQCF